MPDLDALRQQLAPGARLYWIQRTGPRGLKAPWLRSEQCCDVFDVAILHGQRLERIGAAIAAALGCPYWHHWAGFEVRRVDGPEVLSRRLLVALWPAQQPSPAPFRISIL